jgi:hypothetical protein
MEKDKPVLEALLLLLRVEKKASASTIARASGVSYRKVLEVLDANRKMLDRNKRGQITGLSGLRTKVYEWRQKQLKEGRAYTVDEINYGSDKALHFSNPRLEGELQQRYTEGCYGDSRSITVVLATKENIARLEEEGLRELKTFKKDPEEFWKEVGE